MSSLKILYSMEAIMELNNKLLKAGTLEDKKKHWAKVIAEQIASGMKISEFCRVYGLSSHVFRYWKYLKYKRRERNELSEEQQNNDAVSFTPVEVNTSDFRRDTEEGKPGQVKITFKNGHSISVNDASIEKVLTLIIAQISQLL